MPTFGPTTSGSLTDSWNSTRQIGSYYTLTEAGSVTSITGMIQATTANFAFAIYTLSGTTPSALKGVTQSGSTTAGWVWYTANFTTPVSLTPASYYLMMTADQSFGQAYTSVTNGGFSDNFGEHTFDSWSDPWTSGTQRNYGVSIYATYNAISGIKLKRLLNGLGR